MNVLSRATLEKHWTKHPESKDQLLTWYKIARAKKWKNLNEVLETFPKASILKNNRVKFKIKGNDFRLIVRFNCEGQRCLIKWVGTHAEYNKIDANTV